MTVLERPGRRCGATNRQGERCGNLALRGQRVCRFHGGKSPQAKTAAARREVERKAFEALARHKAVPINDPLTAFKELAGEVVAVKDWLGGIVEDIDGIRYSGRSGEQLRGELQAYTGLLDQCRRVLADYGRLGIDERLSRVTEAQMHLLAGALALTLDKLGFVEADRDTVRRLVSVVLRAAAEQTTGALDLPEDLAGAMTRLRAQATAPDRTAALEAELERTRAEVWALVGQRDDLLDALRRNRSGPPLAIEPARPAEVVVERESITVPDVELDDPVPVEKTRPESPAESRPRDRRAFSGSVYVGDGYDD